MNFNKTIIVAVIAILAVTACRKKETPAPGKKTPPKDSVVAVVKSVDIYITGVADTDNQRIFAVYFKNDTVKTLKGTGNLTSETTGIAIKDTNVYITGIYTALNAKSVACYWKNGVINKFVDSTNTSGTSSIAVNGNDIYIAGSISTPAYDGAVYWKNGILTTLPHGTLTTRVTSIAVNGNDVYLAGTIDTVVNNNHVANAVYWKNGQIIKLKDNAIANAIAVNNNGVYVVGVYNNFPIYWKDGVEQPFDVSGIDVQGQVIAGALSAVSISGNDVYVAGYLANGIDEIATYWKNGTPVLLDDASEVSMAVNGSDVYITGIDFTGNGVLFNKGVRDLPFSYATIKGYYSTGIALKLHY